MTQKYNVISVADLLLEEPELAEPDSPYREIHKNVQQIAIDKKYQPMPPQEEPYLKSVVEDFEFEQYDDELEKSARIINDQIRAVSYQPKQSSTHYQTVRFIEPPAAEYKPVVKTKQVAQIPNKLLQSFDPLFGDVIAQSTTESAAMPSKFDQKPSQSHARVAQKAEELQSRRTKTLEDILSESIAKLNASIAPSEDQAFTGFDQLQSKQSTKFDTSKYATPRSARIAPGIAKIPQRNNFETPVKLPNPILAEKQQKIYEEIRRKEQQFTKLLQLQIPKGFEADPPAVTRYASEDSRKHSQRSQMESQVKQSKPTESTKSSSAKPQYTPRAFTKNSRNALSRPSSATFVQQSQKLLKQELPPFRAGRSPVISLSRAASRVTPMRQSGFGQSSITIRKSISDGMRNNILKKQLVVKTPVQQASNKADTLELRRLSDFTPKINKEPKYIQEMRDTGVYKPRAKQAETNRASYTDRVQIEQSTARPQVQSTYQQPAKSIAQYCIDKQASFRFDSQRPRYVIDSMADLQPRYSNVKFTPKGQISEFLSRQKAVIEQKQQQAKLIQMQKDLKIQNELRKFEAAKSRAVSVKKVVKPEFVAQEPKVVRPFKGRLW